MNNTGKKLLAEYPEYLAVRKSQEAWAHYQARGGIGGRDDVTYIQLDSYKQLADQVEILQKALRDIIKHNGLINPNSDLPMTTTYIAQTALDETQEGD